MTIHAGQLNANDKNQELDLTLSKKDAKKLTKLSKQTGENMLSFNLVSGKGKTKTPKTEEVEKEME